MDRRRLIAIVLATVCLIATAIPSIVMAQTDKEERVKFSMAALKAKTGSLGASKIEGVEPTGGKDWPALYFGTTKMNNSTKVVDEVVNQHGGIATLFVRAETSNPNFPRFVRVSTTLKKDDGARAIGTTLAPESGALLALTRGESVYGFVNILGRVYFAGYEPIKDASGKVIGAYSVGLPS
jgi:Cache 3/Cache 2 fusion domain